MKVLHLNNSDPVGVNWILHQELKKLGIESRHVIFRKSGIHRQQQGTDIIAEDNMEEFKRLLDWADIYHIDGDINCDLIDLRPYLAKKKFIFHNHGGYNLLYPEYQYAGIKACRDNFPYVVCSPLTKLIIPNAIWIPNIVHIKEQIYLPIERDFFSKLMICHKVFSLQSRLYKGSDIIDEMVNNFLGKVWQFNLVLDIFYNMTIFEVLNKTAHYHICIDNLTQGFCGMSGWESLSKGQVVIARLDPVVQKAYNEFGPNCPIINVSGMDEMCKVIRELYNDREYLKSKCEESRKWMEKYYTPSRIAKMYLKLYEKTLEEE